MQLW